MPSVEADVVPQFSDDEFLAIAVHSFAQGRFPATHVQVFGLTFPLVLDYDSEQFRRYRLPSHVFPLNAVIDQQGNIAHVGIDLEESVEVAQMLLGR